MFLRVKVTINWEGVTSDILSTLSVKKQNTESEDMKRVSKVLVVLAMVAVVLASEVEGGRKLKSKEEKVDHPQSFLGGSGGGGLGGIFPSPGFTGFGFGPSGFCTFPGGCTPTLPINPGLGTPPHA